MMLHLLQLTSTTMDLLPLVCFSLLTCSGTTFADGNGPAVIKVVVEEDSDAVLNCSLSTTSIKEALFDWKKDDQKEVFLYNAGPVYIGAHSGQDEQFRGRVSHFPEQLELGNASIIIRKTQVTDSGTYTCDFPRLEPKRRSIVALVVDPILKIRNVTGAAPEPYITTLDEPKDGVVLQCDVKGAFPKPEVHWQDSEGNIIAAEDPQVTERGGRFYITLKTTVNRSSRFRCVATQKEIYHQIYAETYVPLKGAVSKPSIERLDETNDQALLQCEVQGAFPKPKLHWQDSEGNILDAEEPKETERGGSYNIILQTTVTKTDKYRCVAAQEEINHQTDTETYVRITGSSDPSHSYTGLVVTIVVLVIILVLVLVGMCYILKRRQQGGHVVVRYQDNVDS